MSASRLTFAALLLGCFALMTAGQTVPRRIGFEVATIKPASPDEGLLVASGKKNVGLDVRANHVDIGYQTLANLISLAYGVKNYQVTGPDWVTMQRYDVIATLPDGATREFVPRSVQVLLDERFHLKAHLETRSYPVYVLTVDKNGAKLADAPLDIKVPPNTSSSTPDGLIHMEWNVITMSNLVERISGFVDRPVIDMTGLTGLYRAAIDARPKPSPAATSNSGQPEASEPVGGALFTSIEKLGLHLESRRAPVQFVVVDSADKVPVED